MSEEHLIATRQSKHQQLNGGAYPLAAKEGTASISLVICEMEESVPKTSLDPSELGDSNITIHGRVALYRKSGAISFIKLTDGTGSIQLIGSRAALSTYDNLKLLDLGDIIEVTGKPCLSKTGEKSILIQDFTLLTKAIRPPPEKYLGIEDTETKCRQRYLDLMSSEESRAVFTIRSFAIRAIRDFMEKKEFMEVETSTLNTINCGANAKPFTTHHNALDTDLFLRIAPELYLKRLLVGGFDKVFEIGRNYRNEGISTRHNPEFTMLECYQAYGHFDDLIVMTREILFQIDWYMEAYLKDSFAYSYYKNWLSQRTFCLRHQKVIPMWDAVLHAASIAGILLNASIHPCSDTLVNSDSTEVTDVNNARLQKIDIKNLDHELAKATSVGEKIVILFEFLAEPFLTEDYREVLDGVSYSVPVLITQYPSAVCPLARKNDNNPLLCDRFELFIEGRELANAFQELNDPEEQAKRFKDQLQTNDKDPMDYDSDYVAALQYGMPPAIGFGMGIDRLVMLLTGMSSIKDVILFPTLKPLNGG
jgi:lysyl-tRNA synthetase class 2